MHHPTDRIAHITFVTPVVDRSDDPPHDKRTLLPRSYTSLPDVLRIDLVRTFRTGLAVLVDAVVPRLPFHLRAGTLGLDTELILVAFRREHSRQVQTWGDAVLAVTLQPYGPFLEVGRARPRCLEQSEGSWRPFGDLRSYICDK